MNLRPARPADAGAIADIYNHYIRNTVITFEEVLLSSSDMGERLNAVLSADHPWLVAEADGEILGFAYAGEWKGRCAYRHSVEISIYLAPHAQEQGLGTRLYRALFECLQDSQVHVAIAGIALPNPGSIALHEKFGMEKVAHFPEVGRKFDQWLDVGYWQIIFPEVRVDE